MEELILTGLAGKLLYDIAGPVAKEIGEMVKDELRPYRAVREMKLMEKTARLVQNAGFQPKAVPPKLLLTVIENGGMEDDEELHTKWATLLANGANPSGLVVQPAFPDMLRQLSRNDVVFLDHLYRTEADKEYELRRSGAPSSMEDPPFLHGRDLGENGPLWGEFSKALVAKGLPESDTAYAMTRNNLERLRIIRGDHDLGEMAEAFRSPLSAPPGVHYFFTMFGVEFIRACQPPARKS